MPPIPAPRSSGFTSTTPVPLYWCSYGDPGHPRLLVLHGGPGAHHDYLLPQMLAIADAGFECVFYDQRGGGKSKTDDRAPITWRTHVEDLALVRRELGLEARAIVGYSWGGLLALLAAIELGPPPALALVDPAPVTRAHRDTFEAELARRQASPEVKRLRDALQASDLRQRDPAAFAQRQFELAVAGYFADPDRARDLTPFRVTGRVQQQVWESLGDFDLVPRLAALRGTPVLVVHGREDPIPLASSEAVAAATDGTLEVIDDCGHVPYVEQADALFGALLPFLHAHAR